MKPLGGINIVVHPLLADMKFQVLKLRPHVPVSDRFRKEFDAWLLEMFGTEERAFIFPNGLAYVSPKAMAMIRTATGTAETRNDKLNNHSVEHGGL